MKKIYQLICFILLGSYSIQAQETAIQLDSFLGITPTENVIQTTDNGMPPALLPDTEVFYEVDIKLYEEIDFDLATFTLGSAEGLGDLYTISVNKSDFENDFDASFYLSEQQLSMKSSTMTQHTNIHYEIKLYDNQGNCLYYTIGSL